MVEKLLPEDDWEEMGLHGLSDRRRKKRIEALVGDRLAARRELEDALNAQNLLALRNPGGFAGEIYETFTRQQALPQETEGNDE